MFGAIGVYDPATSSFYLRNANSAGGADLAFGFGGAGSTPLSGDWNNDGVDTIGTWAAGSWYLLDANSSGGADVTFSYASGGVRPITGDWDDAPSSPGGSAAWERSFTYDWWGNRKEVRDTPTGSPIQTVPAIFLSPSSSQRIQRGTLATAIQPINHAIHTLENPCVGITLGGTFRWVGRRRISYVIEQLCQRRPWPTKWKAACSSYIRNGLPAIAFR